MKQRGGAEAFWLNRAYVLSIHSTWLIRHLPIVVRDAAQKINTYSFGAASPESARSFFRSGLGAGARREGSKSSGRHHFGRTQKIWWDYRYNAVQRIRSSIFHLPFDTITRRNTSVKLPNQQPFILICSGLSSTYVEWQTLHPSFSRDVTAVSGSSWKYSSNEYDPRKMGSKIFRMFISNRNDE